MLLEEELIAEESSDGRIRNRSFWKKKGDCFGVGIKVPSIQQDSSKKDYGSYFIWVREYQIIQVEQVETPKVNGRH